VYCQYDWTTNENAAGERLPTAAQITEAAAAAFEQTAKDHIDIQWITLAGNGEPTLHPELEAVVDHVRRLRDRYLPSARIGILSDATTVHRERVRAALVKLDDRFMKLDAGTAAGFLAVNKPMGEVDWERMITSLATLPQTILQCMFIQGAIDNTTPAAVEAWMTTVARIEPIAVQVYSIDRPPAEQALVQVSHDRLQAIADALTARTGIPAEVF
jgi:wyosine [tRNA(Phe)-imidazoG37] synthetase (radical SAM superfamily)